MFTVDLENKVRAGYTLLYVTAREDWRCVREIKRVAESVPDGEEKMAFRAWTAVSGWTLGDPNARLSDTVDVLEDLKRLQGVKSSVCVMVNYHRYLDDPLIIQWVKDLGMILKRNGSTLIFVSNILKLPPELESDITVIDFGLPDKALLLERLRYLSDGDVKSALPEDTDPLVEAALGMTTREAEDAFALSLVETKMFSPTIVSREKSLVVRKGGLLEFYPPIPEGLDAVGGLDNLKGWLRERRGAFSQKARDFGIPPPRGILLVGIPGCGKSLTAKAVSTEWQLPLLRLDLGRIFQGIVGSSEANMRSAMQTADAIAPCVLWIDEVEKGMSGLSSSGATDSGVSSRVFGSLITWMQEKNRPVFLVLTANNVAQLPPEFLRAGRLDEVFAVDLPNEEEREQIFQIHLRKRGRDYFTSDSLHGVVADTNGFSGAEIESVVIKGLYSAFARDRELLSGDLVLAARNTVPLSVTRREEVEAMRQWASQRAVPASSSGALADAVQEKRRVRLA